MHGSSLCHFMIYIHAPFIWTYSYLNLISSILTGIICCIPFIGWCELLLAYICILLACIMYEFSVVLALMSVPILFQSVIL